MVTVCFMIQGVYDSLTDYSRAFTLNNLYSYIFHSASRVRDLTSVDPHHKTVSSIPSGSVTAPLTGPVRRHTWVHRSTYRRFFELSTVYVLFRTVMTRRRLDRTCEARHAISLCGQLSLLSTRCKTRGRIIQVDATCFNPLSFPNYVDL